MSSIPGRLAQLLAVARIGIGCAALAAPTIMTRPWIGDAAGSPDVRLLARTMAGRDLALGLGTLRALGVGEAEGRPWVALAGMADAVDAAVTVVAFRRLPRFTRWVVLASTGGAALVSCRVALALEPDGPDPRDDRAIGVTPSPGPVLPVRR